MVRDCPAWVVQPKCLLLFFVLLIFLIFAFTSPKQVYFFVEVLFFFFKVLFFLGLFGSRLVGFAWILIL
jgi:hypothetical protein